MEVAAKRNIFISLAREGMLSKLFVFQVPEVMALVSVMSRIAQQKDCTSVSASRAFIILRGIRGTHGIPAAAKYVVPNLALLGATEVDTFIKTLTEHMKAKGAGKRASWAAHCEGRHRCLSGMKFIDALAHPAGHDGFLTAASNLEPYMIRLLAATPDNQASFSALDLIALTSAVEGTVVLAIKGGTPQRARNYNAMEFSRQLILWGFYDCRAKDVPMEQILFDFVGKQQSINHRGEVQDALVYFGISDAISFRDLHDVLRDVARPVLLPDTKILQSLTTPFIWAGLCEAKQAINSFTAPMVCRAISAASQLQPVLRQTVTELQRLGTAPDNTCHLEYVITKVLTMVGMKVPKKLPVVPRHKLVAEQSRPERSQRKRKNTADRTRADPRNEYVDVEPMDHVTGAQPESIIVPGGNRCTAKSDAEEASEPVHETLDDKASNTAPGAELSTAGVSQVLPKALARMA